MSLHFWIWLIAAIATAGVILRPFGWPEAIWAVAGAILLVVFGLLSPNDAWLGIAQGGDVYLFLAGMMLLAEIARAAGLFDYLAAHAVRHAKGSGLRLFVLIYAIGTLVTIFLSNDATAAVLTPAVAAAVRTAGAPAKLPYLLICAFIANAASFVLPISDPANLVIYGHDIPPLGTWLPRYLLPALLSILVTYLALYLTQRRAITQPVARDVPIPMLSPAGRMAAVGIGLTALILLSASAIGVPLGLPTVLAGAATAVIVAVTSRAQPWRLLQGISWSVLPLVAGLFVLVRALAASGLIGALSATLSAHAAEAASATEWATGIVLALASNLMNNLPAGLIAADAIQGAHATDRITSAVLIGIDLGPNLPITGSLATILWLATLRREGHAISAGAFLKLGLVIMPPALLAALAAALALG